MNWDEVIKPLVEAVNQSNKQRIERNPALVGALDQDKMFFRELFQFSGIAPSEYTLRDYYMMISTIWMLWAITQRAEENGNIDSRGVANVMSASGTLAYGITSLLMPSFLDQP